MSKVIRNIQKDYLDLLSEYIEPLGKEALTNHIESGSRYAGIPYLSKIMLAYLENLPNDIELFWRKNQKTLMDEIQNLRGLKLCYSGDISPSNASKLVSKLGLYVDTILIPDPLIGITRTLSEFATSEFYLRSIIRHSLNVLKLRPLIEAELNPPIAIIFPSTQVYSPDFRKRASSEAQEKAVRYMKETFDINLPKDKDPMITSRKIKKVDEVIRNIKKTENLIPDWTQPNIKEGLESFMTEVDSFRDDEIRMFNSVGQQIYGYSMGRIMSFQEHFYNCGKLYAEPLYDSPNSWKMFTWYLKDIFPHGNILKDSSLVANAQGVTNTKWLGGFTEQQLIEIRGNGELEKIRNIITKDINRIQVSALDDLESITNQVKTNLGEAFHEHSKEITDLGKKFKIRYSIGTPIVITGALFGFIPDPVALAASVPTTLFGFYEELRGRDDKKSKMDKLKKRNNLIGLMYEQE